MYFTFAFVMAIVEERDKLLSIANWPTNFASLMQYAVSVDKIAVFDDIQKDETFRKLIKFPYG
jgi:hypothetical protein